MPELEREIAGALKQTINAHGPITANYIPSATKRIATRYGKQRSESVTD